jgi:hypothetical protein
MKNIYFGRGIKFMHKNNRVSMLLNHSKGFMSSVQNLRNIQGKYADDVPSDKMLNQGNGKVKQLSKLKYKF